MLFFRVVGESIARFVRHGNAVLGGSIAFYLMLSAAPLLVLTAGVAGLVFGEAEVQAEVVRQLENGLGGPAARFMAKVMTETERPGGSWWATAIGAIVLLVAASRLFVALQTSLNHTWGVRIRSDLRFKTKALSAAVARLLSFGMVFICGLLLMALLVLKAGLSMLAEILDERVVEIGGPISEFLLTVLLASALTSILYKVLPDVRVHWKDVVVGGFTSGFMLGIGTVLFGLYLGHFGARTTYGAAGTVVVTLLWIYYAAQIFLLGAEFTGVWAKERGRAIRPNSTSVQVVEPNVSALTELLKRLHPEQSAGILDAIGLGHEVERISPTPTPADETVLDGGNPLPSSSAEETVLDGSSPFDPSRKPEV